MAFIESDEPAVPEAFKIASRRGLLPTSMGTAELRELDAGIRRNSVFAARATSAVFVSKIKEVIDGVLSGDLDEASARLALKETLQALNYTPEGGFPDAPAGSVPPALKGTIEDLSSDRRLNLILRTQAGLMRGAAQKLQGHDPGALRQFPAWELVRVEERKVPRDWEARWVIAMENLDRGDELPRDDQGNVKMDEVRMIAMKGDPIWAALGSSELFDDALDVDHPPFAFESGRGWDGKDAAELEALGIKGPKGKPLENVIDALPRPQASVAGIAPDVLARLKKMASGYEIRNGKLVPVERKAS